jgi:hypothetical protein
MQDNECVTKSSVLHLRVPTAINTNQTESTYSGGAVPMGLGPYTELYPGPNEDCYTAAWRDLNGQHTGVSVAGGTLIATRNTGSDTYMGEETP